MANKEEEIRSLHKVGARRFAAGAADGEDSGFGKQGGTNATLEKIP